ncbi:MAG: head-tail connector protein [Acetobacteraceae bacterium]|nr:head-tail connector protein [Acetobacteraceae bacterium]
MADDLARDLIRRADALKGNRGTLESLWEEIAELVRPTREGFVRTMLTEGQKRGLAQYDAAPASALEQLAAGLWGGATNSATEWFSIAHPDDAVSEDREVKLWLDIARQVTADAFAAQGQRFYTQALELYADLGAFGTGIFFVDEDVDRRRLFFSTRNLRECCIAQDDREAVDTVYRRFAWSAEQAMARWGDRAPEKVRKAAADGKPDTQFDFLHAVYPNRQWMPRRMDAGGKRWASVYVALCDMSIVQRGGYEEFPYCVPRWGTTQGGLYGESPAMAALTDIKVLNAVERDKLKVGAREAQPPLLAPDENAIRGVKLTPSGITYGGVNADGQPLVRPLITGSDLRVFEGMAEQKREAIRQAFHNTLMLMAQRPNATATEVLEVKEERLRLLGPQLSRIETEFLDPLIRRVFQLLWRAQAFPPPPPALAEDARVKVEYVSQLTVAQRSGAAAAILRGMSSVLPMAEANPAILDNIDMDQVTRRVIAGFGAPAAILRDPRQVAAEREARAQAQAQMQQMQQVAAMAQPMAQGAKAVRDIVGAGREAAEMPA